MNKRKPRVSKNLTLLSETEQFALYGLPDFDDKQQMDYFIFTEQERTLLLGRYGLPAQVYCALQIGYFKAKHLFFNFSWKDVAKEDVQFILDRYFSGRKLKPHPITKHEYYAQRIAIAKLLGYRLWSKRFLPLLREQMANIMQRDVSPSFIVTELVVFLNQQKIIRPGYTIFQTLISESLTVERKRLGKTLNEALDEQAKTRLKDLLVKEETLSELAALKQDAKNFNYRMMVRERKKQEILKPLYKIANEILPKLSISKKNIEYYASLAHYYTIYDLRRIKPEQTYLYLLCYAWQRYRQLNDNLVDAFCYHTKKFDDKTKEQSKEQFFQIQVKQKYELQKVGHLLLLYVDDSLNDDTQFGEIRQRAFAIIPKDRIQSICEEMCKKPISQIELWWLAIDQISSQYKKHLRPLLTALDFSSSDHNNPWLRAIQWLKDKFLQQDKIKDYSLNENIEATIPKSLRPYLLLMDDKESVTGLNLARYEFWIYHQIKKCFGKGELYLEDSAKHRFFDHELISLEKKESMLKTLKIPWLQTPLDEQLQKLSSELHELWLAFNEDLRLGKLDHLEYDANNKTLSCRKLKASDTENPQNDFYEKFPLCDITDVLRFVNSHCHFLSALTPLQPRNAKKIANEDSLIAVTIAQAMNHGNLKMSEISDIPYDVLKITNQQCFRLATLKTANDIINNAIAKLSIFPHYSFDLKVLYGSVDGQKFDVKRPTAKARHSKKYFRNGKGVVAYTLLANHVSLQTYLLGPQEPESYYLFDIWYNNTSDIVPEAVTGDMHSINKVNFAISHWFGLKLEPRFTNPQFQLKHLYCGHLSQYKECLIQPIEQLNFQLITEEKQNIDRIVASLALKEISQSTLVKKLCAYTQDRTRKAIFEFDKLVRSIYTLKYLRDPNLQRNVHRSQNRIEAYHQLRAAIAEVGGRKELSGNTDIAIEISNQCGRLIANALSYYNSAILSRLFEKYQASGNQKALALIKKRSPIAWQHIHFSGHYIFNSQNIIDIDKLIANLILDKNI